MTLAQYNALAKQFIIGQETLDFRSAQICWIIAEVNRDRKKRSKAYTPKDFMPRREAKEAPKKLTGEQMLERVKMINIALGGKAG